MVAVKIVVGETVGVPVAVWTAAGVSVGVRVTVSDAVGEFTFVGVDVNVLFCVTVQVAVTLPV